MLRDVERRDGMGRRRRVTRMLSYREAREYTPSNVEMSEIDQKEKNELKQADLFTG